MKSSLVSEMMFPWKPSHPRRAVIVLTHWSRGSRYGCLLWRHVFVWKPGSWFGFYFYMNVVWNWWYQLIVEHLILSLVPSCFKNLVRVPCSVLLFQSFLCTRFFFPSEQDLTRSDLLALPPWGCSLWWGCIGSAPTQLVGTGGSHRSVWWPSASVPLRCGSVCTSLMELLAKAWFFH